MAKKTIIGAPELIKQAQEHIRQEHHWVRIGSLSYALERQTSAKAIIEILEGMECGSHGGVNCGFPVGKTSLQKRLDHLKKVFL